MRRVLMITAMASALAVSAAPGADAAITWTVQPTPTPAQGVDGQLLAVSCVSASDCTAVGGYTSNAGPVTLAEHWDGTGWTVQATPNPTGAIFSILEGASCPTASDCTAVGEYDINQGTSSLPLAEHWNGSTWTIQAMPAPAGAFGVQVKAVSCPTAASCTAVGSYLQQGSPGLTLAESWNGSTWAVQPMPRASPVASLVSLTGVSCPAPGKCTAVGWFQRRGTRAFVTLAENNYSGSWRVRSARGPSATLGQLNGVSCTVRANCTAVGTPAAGPVLAEHWDGSTWIVQPTPGPVGGALNGVFCVSASSCTAVGTIPPTGVDQAAIAERFAGGAWRRMATASPAANEVLAGVSCVSASTCTAAGYHAVSSTTVQSPLAEQSSGN
jgi:hypothetical protein